MDYRIVSKEDFTLLAKVAAFRNECATEDGNHEVADFWTECIESGVIEALRRQGREKDLYGVCSPVAKKSSHFEYGIGVKTSLSEAPAGYRIWPVKPGTWAVFECIGTDGDCIDEMWQRILKEFLPSSRYELQDSTDFELYPADHENGVFCELWIPVKEQ